MTTMKLILTQEVTGLGSSGDTVEVKGGYGRNYLLPRGLAIKATRGAEKQVESLRRARAQKPPGGRRKGGRAAARGGAPRGGALAGGGGGGGRPPLRPDRPGAGS